MAKTAKGLVEYAKAQIGRPYWNGTFGQAASKDLYDQNKKRLPKKYQWEYNPAEAGKKVHDCVGLIKGYLWCESPNSSSYTYNVAQDLNESMMYDACTKKGSISTLPEVPGVIVFKTGHAGVYIGGGKVIEARGRSYGVVETKLADRGWTDWGYHPDIVYEEPKKEEPKPTGIVALDLPVLKRGAKGDTVRAMQFLLIGYGYDMEGYGADASFGGATERAVKAYQSSNGLEADGSCGPKTWRKLLGVNTA